MERDWDWDWDWGKKKKETLKWRPEYWLPKPIRCWRDPNMLFCTSKS